MEAIISLILMAIILYVAVKFIHILWQIFTAPFRLIRAIWRLFFPKQELPRQSQIRNNNEQHHQQTNRQVQYNQNGANQVIHPQRSDDAKQKGDDFEKFIVKKFNPRYYKIKEWRGDKFIDGLYAETNKDPDIILEYKWNGKIQHIAIECKYRSYFYQGTVDWAKERQVLHYQNFEVKTGIPTFLILGVGGTASYPKQIFIVPVSAVHHHILNEQELIPFARHNNGDFFFDFNAMNLA